MDNSPGGKTGHSKDVDMARLQIRLPGIGTWIDRPARTRRLEIDIIYLYGGNRAPFAEGLHIILGGPDLKVIQGLERPVIDIIEGGHPGQPQTAVLIDFLGELINRGGESYHLWEGMGFHSAARK
jgi:hypothetical protein